MAGHQVLWSQDAERERDDIVGYIASDNPLEALRIVDRVCAQAQRLQVFAERGRRVPELGAAIESPLRELVVAPWRMIHAIDGEVVRVVAIVDCRRDIEAWLTQRCGFEAPAAP